MARPISWWFIGGWVVFSIILWLTSSSLVRVYEFFFFMTSKVETRERSGLCRDVVVRLSDETCLFDLFYCLILDANAKTASCHFCALIEFDTHFALAHFAYLARFLRANLIGSYKSPDPNLSLQSLTFLVYSSSLRGIDCV